MLQTKLVKTTQSGDKLRNFQKSPKQSRKKEFGKKIKENSKANQKLFNKVL